MFSEKLRLPAVTTFDTVEVIKALGRGAEAEVRHATRSSAT